MKKKSEKQPLLARAWNAFLTGWEHFWSQSFGLLTDPVFVALTIIGNLFVVFNAAIFYWIEFETNPQVNSFLDALWWAFATVTTVGYGDIVPISDLGKVHGILLMLAGTAIFLSFTAIFAKALIGKEIEDVDAHVSRIERRMKKLSDDVQSELND